MERRLNRHGIECRVRFLLGVFRLTYVTNSGFRHVTASMNSKHTAHSTLHTLHHTQHTHYTSRRPLEVHHAIGSVSWMVCRLAAVDSALQAHVVVSMKSAALCFSTSLYWREYWVPYEQRRRAPCRDKCRYPPPEMWPLWSHPPNN